MAGDTLSGLSKWKAVLWPIGGTVFGLLVMPVAMAQYPEFFNSNRWLLPTGVLTALACWVLPLLFHQRVKRTAQWIGLLPKVGQPLLWLLIFGAAALLFFSGRRLFQFHEGHLAEAVERMRHAGRPETSKAGSGAPSAPLAQRADTEQARIGTRITRPPQGARGKPLAASPRKPSSAVGTRILHKSQAQGPRTSSNRLATSIASVKQPPATQKESRARLPSTREAEISAYSELKNVIEAVNNASKDWTNGVVRCQDSHDMWLANVEGPGEPPTQADRKRADFRYVICMKGFEDGFHMEDSMSIRAAVEDAIARMQLPGSEQITPNQALAIRQECKDALTKSQALPSLENPAPEANDTLRFKPLLDFLTRLLNRLGNYPENP